MKKIKNSEITPEQIYNSRREFVKKLGLAAGSMFVGQNIINLANASTVIVKQKITEYRYITTYNNYYEFGTSKSHPFEKSQNFKTEPWNISITGEVEKPLTLSMDEVKRMFPKDWKLPNVYLLHGDLSLDDMKKLN